MKIVKKLSMKLLTGGRPTIPAKGEVSWLANVVGIARGIRTGESNFGPWTALTGEFIAEALTGPKEGEQFRTGTMFMPDVALDLVTPFLNDTNTRGVEFSFRIGVEEDSSSATGYVYTAEFLMEPEENDPLERLVRKALPKPTETKAEKK